MALPSSGLASLFGRAGMVVCMTFVFACSPEEAPTEAPSRSSQLVDPDPVDPSAVDVSNILLTFPPIGVGDIAACRRINDIVVSAGGYGALGQLPAPIAAVLDTYSKPTWDSIYEAGMNLGAAEDVVFYRGDFYQSGVESSVDTQGPIEQQSENCGVPLGAAMALAGAMPMGQIMDNYTEVVGENASEEQMLGTRLVSTVGKRLSRRRPAEIRRCYGSLRDQFATMAYEDQGLAMAFPVWAAAVEQSGVDTRATGYEPKLNATFDPVSLQPSATSQDCIDAVQNEAASYLGNSSSESREEVAQ